MAHQHCQVPPADVCWPSADTQFICDECIDFDDADQVALFESAWAAAAGFVYRRTCHRWPGTCFEERVRPCVQRCWCRTNRGCSCGAYNRLNLFGVFCLPVVELLQVQLTGGDCCPCQDTVTWTPTSGHVRLEWEGNSPILVRQRVDDDDCCGWWPKQDLCRPDGGECTWSVTVRSGEDPPPDVLIGTGHLALEIIKECQTRGCTPAQGATSVTTRGVTYERDDDEIGTGMWWDILSSTFDEFGCGPSDFERFVTPGGSPHEPSFHSVFGPRQITTTP